LDTWHIFFHLNWVLCLTGSIFWSNFISGCDCVICWSYNLLVELWLSMNQDFYQKNRVWIHHIIVMIDSITCSFCLRHYVQNGLSYLGKETWPKLCLKRRQANSGVASFGTNKHQLLHRIASIKTPLIYNKSFIRLGPDHRLEVIAKKYKNNCILVEYNTQCRIRNCLICAASNQHRNQNNQNTQDTQEQH